MSENPEIAARRLADARQRGVEAEVAEALAECANALVRDGRIGEAGAALDEATKIHSARGAADDEARCAQMAGTLCRLQGKLDEALQRELHALERVQARGPIAVSAYAELGEIDIMRGRGLEAAAKFAAAIQAGGSDLAGPSRAALLRKRAKALAVAQRYAEACAELETASGLLIVSGDREAAARTFIEHATALQQARDLAAADDRINRARQLAEPAGDHAALADIHLLLATQALLRHDRHAAMEAAQAARAEALAGNAPASYIAAVHTIAQLAESAGDQLGAYEAIATGWATIADLPHPSLAKTAFEPTLRAMRERWGPGTFDQVKREYEDSRRKVLSGG
jgi:tetratricopeptide (TPR) repeat protein